MLSKKNGSLLFILSGLVIGIVIGALLGITVIAPARPETGTCAVPLAISASPTPGEDLISFLFVQEGKTGSLVNGANGTLALTLTGVRPDTIFFSDRPARVSGGIATSIFTGSSLWNSTSAPNAALMLANAPPANDTVILSLSDPAYDPANATLRYTAVLVPNYTGSGLKAYETFADPGVPEQFGQAMLFIDNADIPVTVINTTGDRKHPDLLIFS
ncbi:MAG: hypothetical protein WC362_08385 [Methanoregula sp.]|jgi:hypothetical protein